jgi:hypothetical protein
MSAGVCMVEGFILDINDTINKSQFDRNEITAQTIFLKITKPCSKRKIAVKKNDFPNYSNEPLCHDGQGGSFASMKNML